jgi:hypothetical protein
VSDGPKMSMLLHGESGMGKSWLAGTAPRPRLHIDVEGRAHHIGTLGRFLFWDPLMQSPPVDDGTWDTCIVKVLDFTVLMTVKQWLRSGQHPFRTVTVDSLMEAQKRWMDKEIGGEQMKTQDWGAVLRTLESFVRDMRDYLAIPATGLDCAIIVTGSVPDERGKARPLLQGALKNTLPYYVDVVGWLHVDPDPQNPTQLVRLLSVGPTGWAVTKYGIGITPTPSDIRDPDLTRLYNREYEQGVTPAS